MYCTTISLLTCSVCGNAKDLCFPSKNVLFISLKEEVLFSNIKIKLEYIEFNNKITSETFENSVSSKIE